MLKGTALSPNRTSSLVLGTPTRIMAIVTAFLIVVIGCSSETKPAENNTQEQPYLAELTSIALKKLTREPVQVSAYISGLCIALPKEKTSKAIAEHGPHAFTDINVYMTDRAAYAFESATVPYPVGSIISKQKLSGSIQTDVGGMIKRKAGYDPDHGDWEYFYYSDSSALQSGRMESCIDCHTRARNTDYVFGSWRTDLGEYSASLPLQLSTN